MVYCKNCNALYLKYYIGLRWQSIESKVKLNITEIRNKSKLDKQLELMRISEERGNSYLITEDEITKYVNEQDIKKHSLRKIISFLSSSKNPKEGWSDLIYFCYKCGELTKDIMADMPSLLTPSTMAMLLYKFKNYKLSFDDKSFMEIEEIYNIIDNYKRWRL